DCYACHKSTTTWQGATYNHVPMPTSCNSCHGDGKSNDAFPPTHFSIGTQDCYACHRDVSNWRNATFNHTPTPQSCNSCHANDRPNTGNRMTKDPNLSNNSHYGATDCFACHWNKDRGGTPWQFKHQEADGSKMQHCLPCHYDKGIKEHGNRPSWFQSPIYNFSNGQLGNCYDCHNRGKSWSR
ncbi:MAG: hypothetical protein KDD68_17380, partial [Bdellovibrionales bacterium]|nr:hypothetical protein [Bdellovibrionales bacterium]